uniref:Uncharacterized protein n=1 Tax=Terrapene triunguis TaxID=2587831 RepID=A0A674IXB8_9SAUR
MACLLGLLAPSHVGNLTSRSDLDIKFINLPKSRLQTSLFTHSDWNIIMSVVFSYKSHHRPVLLWVIGIKCDEFISAVFIQSINSDGIVQSICKKKHFHLGLKYTTISHCVLIKIFGYTVLISSA